MQVGVLGSGIVAQVLAAGFMKHGHAVTIGTRSPEKLAGWKAKNRAATVGSFAEAAAFGDVLVLAVKGAAAEDVLRQAGAAHLAGKTVMDACNPIAEVPPVKGVLQYFTGPNESLMERLQAAFPDARLVKAFSCVGNGQMVNPVFKEGRPTMFICGNDAAAKQQVRGILDQFGWEAADMGEAESARAIEPLAMLWCISGFRHNQWTHAFKVIVP